MNKNYTGIDYFRFIAALLIIAIHTSPLGSFSETGDFIVKKKYSRIYSLFCPYVWRSPYFTSF